MVVVGTGDLDLLGNGHRLEQSREGKAAGKKEQKVKKKQKRKCVMDISLLHGQEKPFCQTFFLKWLQLH
jgi:hypothetical protein